ncbi:autotransporter-associated beta strand protein [Ereboglobus sp. PH5-5]|nr:autotransporter-associated beta strand protein [Ereboglobus sp. PH5-5]
MPATLSRFFKMTTRNPASHPFNPVKMLVPLAAAFLSFGALLPCVRAQTTTITTSTNAPAQLVLSAGTTTIDVAAGALYTFDNLATGGNSAIIGNTAGAVFRTTGSGTTVFINNDIVGRGPGLSLRASGTLDLQNVRFGDKDNPALGNINRQSGQGGGALSITAADALLELRNGEFYYNKSTLGGASGGAIQIASGARSIIDGATFLGNSSANIAGAILYNSINQSHILKNAVFTSNTAASRGSAVSVYAGTVAMTDVAFYGNKTTNTSLAHPGGAVHIVAAARATIDGAVFEQNSSSIIGGGAISVYATGITTITSATFGNATDLTRGNFSSNGAGGAILESGSSNLVLNNAAFYGNFTSTGNGGAIAVLAGGTLSVNGGVFVSNSVGPTAGSQGSAIHLAADTVATITSATFANNNSSSHATVLITGGNTSLKTYTFTDVLFDENYVANEGGGVFLNGGNSRYEFNRARFTGNSANTGGAITTRAGTILTLTDAVFTSNTARAGTGGAISLHLGGLLAYNATVSATHSGNIAGAGAASGGFLYLGAGGTANFNIAPAAIVQIGGESGAHDTISTGTFTDTVININNDPAAVGAAPGDGAGTLILANGDSSSQRGAINLHAGRLLLANSATLGGTITVADGATFGGEGTIDSAAGGALNRSVAIQTGGTLQVGLDGADGAAQTLAIAGNLALANNTAIIGDGVLATPGAGGITLGAAAGDTVTANIAADKLVSITGLASGAGGLLKTGDGTLDLSGANTFAGGVTLASGTLTLGSNTALGTGALAVTGTATVGFSAAATVSNAVTLSTTTVIDSGAFTTALNGAITGPGGIIKQGSGQLALGGALTGVPSIAINAGSLSGNIDSVSAISISNTAAYIGNLARSSGQTLSITTGSIGGNLTLSQGALLEFNLADAGSGASLDISGAFSATGTTTLNFINLGNATYTIVSANSITANNSNFDYTVNGGPLTGRNSLALTVGTNDITVAASYRNLRMTWDGANGGAWDTAASNWNDNGTSDFGETRFVTGDSIRFASTASGTVLVADAGVTAGDIEVASTGALTFTGGAITASATSASVDGVADAVYLSSGTVAATGKFVKKGAGTLTFDNAAGVFEGGLEIEDGVLAFNRAAQLGDASGTISLTGPATLRANGDILGATGTLGGTLVIAAASGTFDTQAHTVESTATLAGSGTLVKIGDGNLILRTTDNAAFAAPTLVSAGSLLLADGAKLGGALTVAPGATAGGIGAFTGGVTVNDGTLLVGDAGETGAGALAIGGALTLNGAARVEFGIHAGGIADTLDVTGAINTANATNVVSISIAGGIASGTYALGNAGALASVQNLEVNGVLIDSSLRIVSELAATSGTLLYIYGMDDSRYMEWTGASGTGTWNIGLANWQGYNGDTGGKSKFQDGDTVRFTGAATASIALESAATVSDMVVDNTGTLTFTGAALSTSVATNGALITNAAGKLVKSGEGALVFENAANTFIGGIELDAGLLAVSTDAQIGTAGAGITLSSGTLRALASLALSDTLTLAGGSAALDTGANAITLTGGIAGSGTLSKLGTGALTLSAATSGASLLSADAVTRIVDGAVLLRDFTAADATATTHTFILDGGWLDLSDTPGFNPATGAGANDWAGLTITGTGGTIIGSNDKITLRDGAILASVGGATIAEQGIFVVVDAGADGVATLASANNYAGRTLLQSGTLRIAADDRLGLVSLNREVRVTGSGAALEITEDGFLSNRTLGLDENGTLSIAAGASGTWAGAITGLGKTLTKAGDGELVITNTGNSTTLAYHVAGGVLEGDATILSRAITLDAAGTVAVNQAADADYTPQITGAGVFEKRGAGVLTLLSALGNTGAVRVAAGTLKTGADNQLSAASPLIVSQGAALDMRGTRQTVSSLSLDGALLLSATVNSNLGAIIASDYLKATDFVTGTGSIALTLSETDEDGYSPLNGDAPSSVILIESGNNTADLSISIANNPDDTIYAWDVTSDGNNWRLSRENLIPVIPAVTGINAAVHIGTQTAFDTLSQRISLLRLANDGKHRIGGDLWVAGAYRHDKIKGTLYEGAKADTRSVQTGVNLVKAPKAARGKSKGGLKYAAGVFLDFTDTDIDMTDADTTTRTGGGGFYLTYQPNDAFHAEGIARLAKGKHDTRVNGMDDMRLGTNGFGLSLSLGHTFRTKSGWMVDVSERILYSITNVQEDIDSAHRLFKVSDVDSFRGLVGVQFSRNVRLFGKWDLRPAFRVAYDHEFKGKNGTTVLRYHDAGRTRLRDRYDYADDFSGGSVDIGAGATLRFNAHFELYADISGSIGGELENYTANLGISCHW